MVVKENAKRPERNGWALTTAGVVSSLALIAPFVSPQNDVMAMFFMFGRGPIVASYGVFLAFCLPRGLVRLPAVVFVAVGLVDFVLPVAMAFFLVLVMAVAGLSVQDIPPGLVFATPSLLFMIPILVVCRRWWVWLALLASVVCAALVIYVPSSHVLRAEPVGLMQAPVHVGIAWTMYGIVARLNRPSPANACPVCGYDRTGLPDRPCPECGASVQPQSPAAP